MDTVIGYGYSMDISERDGVYYGRVYSTSGAVVEYTCGYDSIQELRDFFTFNYGA